MPKGKGSPERTKRREADPPMKDLLSWSSIGPPWRNTGRSGTSANGRSKLTQRSTQGATSSHVESLMRWDNTHGASKAPRGTVNNRWVSESQASFTYYVPQRTVLDTKSDAHTSLPGNSIVVPVENDDIGEDNIALTDAGSVRESKSTSDPSPLFSASRGSGAYDRDDDWVVVRSPDDIALDDAVATKEDKGELVVDIGAKRNAANGHESDNDTVISPRRGKSSGRNVSRAQTSDKKKKKKKKRNRFRGHKKPPFCLYGRSNFSGPNSGVCRGNYLRSHNVLPDQYPNKPSFPQSFKASGKAARIVGGGGRLNDELTETIVASKRRDIAKLLKKFEDDVDPTSPAARLDSKTDDIFAAPLPPAERAPDDLAVANDVGDEETNGKSIEAAVAASNLEHVSNVPTVASETERFLDTVKSENFVKWHPIDHVERDPRKFKHLPPQMTTSIVAAGVKTPRGDSVADVLYLYD